MLPVILVPMGDLKFKEIIEDWQAQLVRSKNDVPRDVLRKIPPLQSDIVTVIQGVRRSGKSTLLAQLQHHLQLPRQRCFFLNFEDPRLSDELTPKLLDEVLKFGEQAAPGSEPRYFLFDEIQNVKDWPKWLHRELAIGRNNYFVITGSNASLLSGRLASAISGRQITIELFPFSLTEFNHARRDAGFEDYCKIGGFPRVLSYPDTGLLLREYFTDIVERDVRGNLAIRSSLTLVQLVKQVYESMGTEVSQRSLAKTLGSSADTIGTYLEACENSYLILRCPFFSFSEKQRAARNRKYYPIDLGLRSAVVTRTGADTGKLLEAAVFLHLRRKHRNVFYWRGEREVDLVVYDGTRIQPIQVTWAETKERHREALSEFNREFPNAEPPQFVNSSNFPEFAAECCR